MRKIVLFLSLSLLAAVSYGQEVVQPEPAQSCILRRGDRYTVDGVTYYNSTAFRGYLKNNNTDLFAQYNKGYKLGMAGWGLLAYGVTVAPSSFIIIFLNPHHHDVTYDDPLDDPLHPIPRMSEAERRREEYRAQLWFGMWMTSMVVASAAFCASIPMLGVGYHKMHKSVDAYNISLQPTPQTYWSIQVSGNGIGVAYNF